MFFENRVMKNTLQKFFRDNFFAFKYFLQNPKAREALAPCRSNAPSTIQIRQKLAKLSLKNEGGHQLGEHSLTWIFSKFYF